MRVPRLPVRLMATFYLVVVLLAMVVVSGMATGFGLFYRLVYVLTFTVVLSYVWNWLTVRSLEVSVDRRSRLARVGDTIEETVTLKNHSRLSKNALEVEDLTDLPGSIGGTVVSVSGHESCTWTVKARARKRGVYTMGPMRVANSDLFGLFRRERLFGGTDNLVIYPNTFDLPGFEVPPADLSGDSSTRKRTYHVTPHASGIRDYASGDSLSRVHWNSTARLGRLMSKEFDLGRAGAVWVLVDLQAEVQAGDVEESTDEYGVTIAASLVKRYLEAELPVGLVAYGDNRYHLPADAGEGQLHRVMQYLAVSKAEGLTPLEVVLANEEPLWSHHSSLIAITSSPSPDWVAAVGELAKRGVKVVVVLVDGMSFGGFVNTLEAVENLYLAGIPTYVVKKGDDIPTALSRRYADSLAPASEQLEQVPASA